MTLIPDWKSANIDLVRAALKDGEDRLTVQAQLALAADQRATVLAGLYAAAATGIVAALTSRTSFDGQFPLLAGGAVTTIVFVAAGILCVYSTLPVEFWTLGNEPESWYEDIAGNKPLIVALGEQAVFYTKHIRKNSETIKRNARFFKWGALLGIAAPAIGTLVAAASRLI